jgi:leucyl aminopeptidase
MLDFYTDKAEGKIIPIQTLVTQDFSAWLAKQSEIVKNWVNVTNFSAKPGTVCYLSGENGDVKTIVLGIADKTDVWSLGALPTFLKAGVYSIQDQYREDLCDLAAIAWGLGHYQFNEYRSKSSPYEAKLLLPNGCHYKLIESSVKATYLIRDMINTPADDMGPTQLAKVAAEVAEKHGAKINVIVGEDLLKENYPAVHTVGRASADAPRLIDITWGRQDHPKVTLIGKGVCFDSGGLDLKPAPFMRFMKKDMAGAAHVLGLAKMIMATELPVQLRVLIPAVENSVSSNAMRPGDIIKMRSGMFVEITNTDAEGRLILADALTEAATQNPDLIIDFATLTGAARVALGPEPGAVFTEDDQLANDMYECALQEQDPLWRLPIYSPYRPLLDSVVADICNADMESVGGGAIMAALFLKEFVPNDIKWLHLDIMAYNLKYKPSRPVGGEAMGMRAVFRYLFKRYS